MNGSRGKELVGVFAAPAKSLVRQIDFPVFGDGGVGEEGEEVVCGAPDGGGNEEVGSEFAGQGACVVRSDVEGTDIGKG